MELAHNGGTRKSPSPTAFQSSVRMRDGSASVICSCSAHREALAFGANVLNLFGWKESRFVRPWETIGKPYENGGFMGFYGILWDYPLVMTNIAENCHFHGFYHVSNGDLNHSYVSHYQRVCWRFRPFQIFDRVKLLLSPLPSNLATNGSAHGTSLKCKWRSNIGTVSLPGIIIATSFSMSKRLTSWD